MQSLEVHILLVLPSENFPVNENNRPGSNLMRL
nr:MAG TPA: hypothetical protein [Caudoviricetes sp.]